MYIFIESIEYPVDQMKNCSVYSRAPREKCSFPQHNVFDIYLQCDELEVTSTVIFTLLGC